MDAPKLFIKVKDGLPVDHPAFEDNLLDAFGVIPPEWEPFARVPNPANGMSTKILVHPEPIYRKINGVWQDYWYVRDKTPEEIEEMYRPYKETWATIPYAHNFATWVFNTTKMRYEPPIPRPTDGKFYRWSGKDNNWKLAPMIPNDGKNYYFDFDNWVNVEITDNV